MVASNQLTLVLPSFSPLLAAHLNQADIPKYLKRIVDKSTFTENSQDLLSCLYRLLYDADEKRDYPSAKLRSESASLCADPCHVYADQSRLLLFHQDIELTDEEAAAFIQHLQPLFNEQGLRLKPHTAKHWLVEADNSELPAMTSINQVEGRSVLAGLPQGEFAEQWLTLWNEIQMSLFDHPLNIEREQRGQLAINSVWFWGKGELPQMNSNWQSVWLEADLAKYFKVEQALAVEQFSIKSMSGNSLCCQPALAWDADWQHQLKQLDEQLFKPLWRALRYLRLKQLTLIVPELGEYQLTPLKSWF